MFERFLIWLVKRFLTKDTIGKLFTEQVFIENPVSAYHSLFRHVAQQPLELKPKQFVSGPGLASNVLLNRFGLTEATYLLTLRNLKHTIISCPDESCQEETWTKFFEQVVTIKAITNALKRRKTLTEFVKANVLIGDNLHLETIVFMLDVDNINVGEAVKFLTTEA